MARRRVDLRGHCFHTSPIVEVKKRSARATASDACGPHASVHVRLPSARALSAASELFRALGDASRLAVLLRLASGPRCVGDLAEETGVPLSTLSQQLKVLHHARLVSRRREGKHVHYALADEHVHDLVAAAIDHANEAGHSPAREERA